MCFFLSVQVGFCMNCDFRFFINVLHKSVEGSPAFKVVILSWDATHKEFGDTLRSSAEAGVRVLAVDCKVVPGEVVADAFVPVEL